MNVQRFRLFQSSIKPSTIAKQQLYHHMQAGVFEHCSSPTKTKNQNQNSRNKRFVQMGSHQMSQKLQESSENGGNRAQTVVLMVPLPAQGHLNQLLHYSRLILSYNIPVHYVGSPSHNRQAKARVHGLDSEALENIRFHDFSLPPFLSPPPNPNSFNKFPSHLQPLFNASAHLRPPVSELLRSLSKEYSRVVVIHDSLMASVVQEVQLISNAEAYNFHSVSAFAIMLYSLDKIESPSELNKYYEACRIDPDKIPSLEDCFSSEFFDFVLAQHDLNTFDSGNIYNSSRAIEKPFMNSLETIKSKLKHWAIGPLNPVKTFRESSSKSRHFCLQWLDKQAPRSVIYVSFGTTTAMEEEQIEQLAIGLEKSKQKFIWVLRDADLGDVSNGGSVSKAKLPDGFEERVKENGIVEREWAPQLEILGHEATGGFMSHCGWNSCMESMSMGVPLAAWPMHSDQPRNSVLVAELLRVGVIVKDWKKRGQLVRSESVEKGVKTLMASKEGDEIRKRAAELGGALRRAVEVGGVSRLELDSFIAHITRPYY